MINNKQVLKKMETEFGIKLAALLEEDINKHFSNTTSSAGEAPANHGSIKIITDKNVVNISSPGGYLEYGTPDIEPRPFIRPAIMRLKKELEKHA
jgi:hypothetical protein